MVCLADKNLNSDNWQVLAEHDGTSFANRYVYGNYIDEVLIMDDGTDYYYYLHDHLFSPAALLNSSGTAVERYEYDAYGKATIYDGTFSTTRDVSTFGNPYLFTGRRIDAMDYNSLTTVTDLKLMYYRNRYYDTDTGRFLQHDTQQYVDGMNLYEYVKSRPVLLIDPSGQWGKYVHYDKTRLWARYERYPKDAAASVASADNAVDNLGGGTSPVPGIGNQGYHFDRNFGVGQDTREKFLEFHYQYAVAYCFRPIDSPEDAAYHLGTSLHPLQDWVAHGDYGIKDRASIWIIHNALSPQTEFGPPGGYPDDPTLDAVGGPRPVESVMTWKLIISYEDRETVTKEVGWAKYTPGTQRITMTKRMTRTVLQNFRRAVQKHGGCRCRKYFGVYEY